MSLFARAKELRQKRADLVAEASKLLTAAHEEKRDMSAEENTKFEKLHKDADELKAQIDQTERQLEAERSLASTHHTEASSTNSQTDEQRRTALHLAAFRNWVRAGLEGLTGEQRELMVSSFQQDAAFRALSAVTGAAGGYTVPQDFAKKIEKALLYYGPMLQVADVFETAQGNDFPYPTVNDTSNIGAQLDESTAAAEDTDPGFGQVLFKSWTYTSKIVLVPVQLMTDSYFDVDQLLADLLGERLGRILNKQATTGVGTTTNKGIITASTLGATTASATAIAWTELVDLEHSVDVAYRPGSRWMMHDTTVAGLKKLVDNYGRPLFLPGIASGAPDTIMGYPFSVNNDMDQVAATKKTILFGNFKKYKIRRVAGMQMVRFNERYMNALQIGFMCFTRCDSNLVDAGTHPIKYLAQHASS